MTFFCLFFLGVANLLFQLHSCSNGIVTHSVAYFSCKTVMHGAADTIKKVLLCYFFLSDTCCSLSKKLLPAVNLTDFKLFLFVPNLEKEEKLN